MESTPACRCTAFRKRRWQPTHSQLESRPFRFKDPPSHNRRLMTLQARRRPHQRISRAIQLQQKETTLIYVLKAGRVLHTITQNRLLSQMMVFRRRQPDHHATFSRSRREIF